MFVAFIPYSVRVVSSPTADLPILESESLVTAGMLELHALSRDLRN